jgi:5-methylcytosine-specific restriction endonuclease McrA
MIDRPLEREFAERAYQRGIALDRQQIEQAVRDREWAWANLQLRRDGLDEWTWERLMRAEAHPLNERTPPVARLVDRVGWSSEMSVQQLRALPYRLYLLTEHWQAVRHRALVTAEYRCQECAGGTSLQVHHKTYDRLGEELPADVAVLCASCHKARHQPQP